MASYRFSSKDPDEVLDYPISFVQEFVGPRSNDTLDVVDVTIIENTITTPLSIDSTTVGTNEVVVWLSGGEAGTLYSLNVNAQTTEGRTYDFTVDIGVRDK